MLRNLVFIILIVMCHHTLTGQFGYGFTVSNDLYHRYVNPKVDNSETSRSAGSALLNIGIGPKIWVGGKKISFSAEAQAIIGFLGLATSDYKGMGTAAFPILGKFNFGGLSTFDREGKTGWSIGGGIQYSRTEIYGLTDKYAASGLKRSFFPTYVIQAGFGYGLSGFTATGIVRYGFNPDDKSSTLSIGLQYDFNGPMLKKISNPESEL